MATSRRRKRNRRKKNRYVVIIERIFSAHFAPGTRSFEFVREEIEEAARASRIKVPKNLGDVLYSFRYRAEFPPSITECAPEGEDWIILPAGKGRYRFALTHLANIHPDPTISSTKVPDATPGIVVRNRLSDEQALLAILRYNRLVDIFLRLTCYSLQNHLRTTVPDMGQIETDELYVGLERTGAHYVVPVQAKGGQDRISVVQVVQDFGLCLDKFPSLVCIPVAAQFMDNGEIALFAFENTPDGPVKMGEKHFRLVKPNELEPADLEQYRLRVRDISFD